MKFPGKLLAISLTLVAAISLTALINVSAEDVPMTTQQIEIIRSNCVSVKNTLNQLHASDALLRVNMGQRYESMSTKLMDGFNGRVSGNHFDSSTLVSSMNSYNSMLDTFRAEYKNYEEHLFAVININCQAQPVAFYDAIAAARTQRDKVHLDIVRLNLYLDQYKSNLDQFEKDYQVATDGVKQ